MSSLPETWDDVKFIDGVPGKYAVVARKKGDQWYIAGINGENIERTVMLNVPFINKSSRGILITDSSNAKDFINTGVDFSKPIKLDIYPFGGFVIKTILKGEKSDVYTR